MNDSLSKLIAAYQRMDDWGQRLVLTMAEAQAQKHPAESQPRPQAVANKGSIVAGSSVGAAIARGARRRHGQHNPAVYTREPPVLYVVK